MHKKRRTIRTIRENLERVITINPRRKTLEEKKKHITKKKKRGRQTLYQPPPPSAFLAFLLRSQSLPHQTLFIPQSQPPGAATPHKKRAYHTGEQHCAQPPHPRKKGSLVFRLLLPAVFPFRPSSS